MRYLVYTLLFFYVGQSHFAYGKMRLPCLVGNNMVLQRDKPIKIWGWAEPSERITVFFKEKRYTAFTQKTGRWDVQLSKQAAGGPYKMMILGKEKDTVELSNILIGDVWLCSGQSNMYFKTMDVTNGDFEIQNANYSDIRLFAVPTIIATAPTSDAPGKWTLCNPETVKNFSAVAYFFAQYLHSKVKVPIGLIQSAYGGTPIEGWISADGIKGDPQFGLEASKLASFDMDETNKKMLVDFNRWIDSVEKSDPAYTNGTYNWSAELHATWPEMELPAYFENKDRSLKNRDGILWFSRSVTLSAADLQGGSSFNMGPVINDDMVFINGVKIGGTREAKYTARQYAVPANVMHEGLNIFTVRVIDYGDLSGINGKPEQFYLKTPDKTIPLSGKWHYKVSLDTVFKTQHDSHLNQEHEPSLLYNAMIAPVTNYSIKAVLWYQGESNTSRAYQYKSLFVRLITDWRNQFKQQHLPFLYVQLPHFNEVDLEPKNSTWAELREAQTNGLTLPQTGMANTIDLGEAKNIHPKNKQEVGLRLSLLARSIIYHEKDIVAEGPFFKGAKFKKNRALIYLRNTGGGLKANNGEKYLYGFQVATSGSEKFVFAKAFIVANNRLELKSPDGHPVTAVRYAWADNPGPLNLVNGAGLLAYPFRTDDFKETSYDARYVNK